MHICFFFCVCICSSGSLHFSNWRRLHVQKSSATAQDQLEEPGKAYMLEWVPYLMLLDLGSPHWQLCRFGERHKHVVAKAFGKCEGHPNLVCGLEHEFYFSICMYGNNTPIWLIFFRGVGQPPSSSWNTMVNPLRTHSMPQVHRKRSMPSGTRLGLGRFIDQRKGRLISEKQGFKKKKGKTWDRSNKR